ncbi:MAG: aspartate-semialdehyde dehydrogenase [Chloroflexota bacterium]
MRGYRVAIIGATGLVGRELIKILEQRNFPLESASLYASDRLSGRKMFVSHREIEVKEVSPVSFKGIDIAFFLAGTEVSRYLAPLTVQSGAIVIDNTIAFSLMPNVPMVVPEVNAEDIKGHTGIITNPNGSVIQLTVALQPLHRVNPIKRLTVATYQSISATGNAALEELTTQLKQVMDGQNTIPHVYPHQIAFNVLPEIDVFLDNGYTREEWRMVEETKKIMHADAMAISATCVRVPVFIGHGQAIHIEFSKPMFPDEARRILVQAPGIKVLDDPTISLYPQPWSAAGTDEVFVGRIRQDVSHPNGLAMWVVADNMRKGAALNAVQIAEEIIKRGMIRQGGER